MMYFIAFMLGAPMAAALSDRWGDRRSFVVGGGLAGIVAMLPLLMLEGPIIAALCLLGFGFAQSAISAPQLALVTDLARTEAAAIGETTVVGVFRLIERIGGVLAPTLAATLAIAYGYLTAIMVMAAIASVTALMLRLTLAGHPVVHPPPPSMEAA